MATRARVVVKAEVCDGTTPLHRLLSALLPPEQYEIKHGSVFHRLLVHLSIEKGAVSALTRLECQRVVDFLRSVGLLPLPAHVPPAHPMTDAIIEKMACEMEPLDPGVLEYGALLWLPFEFRARFTCSPLTPRLAPRAVLSKCTGDAGPAVTSPKTLQAVPKPSMSPRFGLTLGQSPFLPPLAADPCSDDDTTQV